MYEQLKCTYNAFFYYYFNLLLKKTAHEFDVKFMETSISIKMHDSSQFSIENYVDFYNIILENVTTPKIRIRKYDNSQFEK